MPLKLRTPVFCPPIKLVNQICLLFLQGSVDPRGVAELAVRLSDMGCYEVSLGDTTGVATPASTLKVLQVVTELHHPQILRCIMQG